MEMEEDKPGKKRRRGKSRKSAPLSARARKKQAKKLPAPKTAPAAASLPLETTPMRCPGTLPSVNPSTAKPSKANQQVAALPDVEYEDKEESDVEPEAGSLDADYFHVARDGRKVSASTVLRARRMALYHFDI